MSFDPSKYKTLRVSNWGHSDPVYKKLAETQQLSGGVCRGMCIDWIRRILLSLGSSHVKKGALITDLDARRRYEKQIAIHKLFNEQSSVPGYFENLPSLNEQAKELHKQLKEFRREGEEAARTKADIELRKNNQQPVSPTEEAVTDKKLNRARSKLGYLTKKFPRVTEEIRYLNGQINDLEMFLDMKFPEMYSNFNEAWNQQKNKPTNFQSIIASKPKTTKKGGLCSKGADIWEDVVVPFLDQIVPGDCALMQAGANEEREPGHAMAFHRSHNGKTYFFDPNFGEFQFAYYKDTVVQDFFVDLWNAHYAQFMWVSLVRLRHAKGETSVAVYDPLVRKLKGSVNCSLL